MSKGNRKAFEDFLIPRLRKLTPSGYNGDVYESLFKDMNDDQFEEFVNKLEAGAPLCIWIDNYDRNHQINYDNVIAMSLEIGLNPEQQLTYIDADTGMTITTPETFIVGNTEVRKQRQMWVKKFGYGKDDTKIDDLTGQVYGDSRGTGMSLPEVRVLKTMGLFTTAKEIYNVKGGDIKALEEFRSSIQETGETNVRANLKAGSGVKSLKSVSELYYGRHIENNFGER